MGNFLTQPSPSDWERWEARLLDGEEPSAAAKAEGQSCSAFKRDDPVRQRDALAAGREARGWIVDERVEGWALADDASDSMKQFWAKRWQSAYGGAARVEVTGAAGGPMEFVDESATLAAVLEKIKEHVGDIGATPIGDVAQP